MGAGIALIAIGVLLFHAGAIGLIINFARRAGNALPRYLLPVAIAAFTVGLGALAGGIALLS